jgi:hypothetical protein
MMWIFQIFRPYSNFLSTLLLLLLKLLFEFCMCHTSLLGNVRHLALSPFCHHLTRPPTQHWDKRDSMVLQVQSWLQVRMYLLCDLLVVRTWASSLPSLSNCPTCKMGKTIDAILERCREESIIDMGKALNTESWHCSEHSVNNSKY